MDAGETVAEDDRRSAPSECPKDVGETVAEVDRRYAPPGNYAENAGETVAEDDRHSAPPGTGITVCEDCRGRSTRLGGRLNEPPHGRVFDKLVPRKIH